MNTKRIHLSSLVLTATSFLFELGINQGWVESEYQNIVFGISLGLMLVALGMNVKVVRSMNTPTKEKQKSQLIMLAVSVYAFLVYGLELI
ncbi:MAG: hypothetical protein HEP71_17720 [Roseivirga sp.]|nr:hypothetical protein [Roseivirga sp.]